MIHYIAMSLKSICLFYAKHVFKKTLSVTDFWTDPTKDRVIFELYDDPIKEVVDEKTNTQDSGQTT